MVLRDARRSTAKNHLFPITQPKESSTEAKQKLVQTVFPQRIFLSLAEVETAEFALLMFSGRLPKGKLLKPWLLPKCCFALVFLVVAG